MTARVAVLKSRRVLESSRTVQYHVKRRLSVSGRMEDPMVIKGVGALSVAKIAAVLYAGIGLLIGVVFALIGTAGFASQLSGPDSNVPFVGMLFGVGAIIILPICYGLMGFIFTLIGATIFNMAARLTGGVQIEVQ
jgi:hypothetical protein